jgi:elongation factor G
MFGVGTRSSGLRTIRTPVSVKKESAGLIVLEPISDLDVVCDEANLGNVVGDLSRRRALVRHLGFGPGAHQRTVRAQLPLAESFDYATILGSLTGGRGRFSTTLHGYQPVERRHLPT